MIQIGIEVESQRITEKSKVQNDTFNLFTKRIERNSSDLRSRIVENFMKNLGNHEHQGSGWVINGIENMHVDYFVKTRSVKTYGKYVK